MTNLIFLHFPIQYIYISRVSNYESIYIAINVLRYNNTYNIAIENINISVIFVIVFSSLGE